MLTSLLMLMSLRYCRTYIQVRTLQKIALRSYSLLQVRLEHILERIGLISDAASTERPSPITDFLFIGGALAARSMYTLRHLGITHVLCLCSNEIGQSDFQYPDLFEYRNFSVRNSFMIHLLKRLDD